VLPEKSSFGAEFKIACHFFVCVALSSRAARCAAERSGALRRFNLTI
jgi:hypothetical protein